MQDDHDHIAEIGITRETLQRTNPDIPMHEPAAKSAWTSFENSLTESEKADELVDWPRPRVAEFIASTANMILAMFDTIEEASTKALISLSMRMADQHIARLDYATRLHGSKFGATHEDFTGSIILVDSLAVIEANAPSQTSRSAELSQNLEAPAPKLGPVWNDEDGSLKLWDHLRSVFSDDKGSPSAQDAALLLIHLEYMSQKNAGEVKSSLEGLNRMGSDRVLIEMGKDAHILTHRAEAKIALSPSSRAKM